ncbi:MAG: HAD-IA family hydrolase [Clostridia bacterium]|nr:HAD-IA family hydrolase [Clostridia bacterium]
MIRAVIFDLDGTLANTIPAIREGLNLTMKLYGYPEHTDAEVLTFINNGARELVRRAMPEELRGDEETVSRVLADYDRLYAETYYHTDRTYDGIPEVIAALHARGLGIAVLSNKQDVFVKRLCEQLLPAGVCDVAQGVIAGKPTKPNRFLSDLVAEKLGVSPSECVMVGDSDVDVKTARAAGMAHVGVSWGFRDRKFLLENGAEAIADTPAELLDMIEKMIGMRGRRTC